MNEFALTHPADDNLDAIYGTYETPADMDRHLARIVRSVLMDVDLPAPAELPADTGAMLSALAAGHGSARHLQRNVFAYERRLRALAERGAPRTEPRHLDEYRVARDTLDGAIARHPAGKRLP